MCPADLDSHLRVAFACSFGDVQWLHNVYTMATQWRYEVVLPSYLDSLNLCVLSIALMYGLGAIV